MKNLKRVFKPVRVVVALLAVVCLTIVKKGLVMFKIKSQYKNIAKINSLIQRFYSVIFNPYRISNGIRPQIWNSCIQTSPCDIEKCHEYFLQRRGQRV